MELAPISGVVARARRVPCRLLRVFPNSFVVTRDYRIVCTVVSGKWVGGWVSFGEWRSGCVSLQTRGLVFKVERAC